jgi:tetratricopeptide (TPR) repeat protein
LAQVRAILQAGFTITGVVVDADYGGNAEFRAGLERLGLSYGVAIRGEAVCAVVGVPGPQSATAIAQSAPEDAWESVTWGGGTAGPLTARFCALRVRPTKGRGDRWLLCERSATDERKYYLLYFALERLGREAEAVDRLEKAARCSANNPVMLAGLGQARAANRDRREALRIARELERLRGDKGLFAYEIGVIHATLGEMDTAFTWLNRAVHERSGWMAYLQVDPRLQGLHDDRRFDDLRDSTRASIE